MRDHTKLQAFQLADKLVLEIYKLTKTFPKEELFGLVSQMTRAAVSVTSNIVEGCARHTESEYLRFLDMPYGSARELDYEMSLSFRLGLCSETDYRQITEASDHSCGALAALIKSYRSERPR